MHEKQQQVKAIETTYNGYRFRSRTEARWAVVFDKLGIEYEYELEGFELKSGRYLPDFYLPKEDMWIEIKGKLPTMDEVRKCEELCHATHKPVVLLYKMDAESAIGFCEYMDFGDGGITVSALPCHMSFNQVEHTLTFHFYRIKPSKCDGFFSAVPNDDGTCDWKRIYNFYAGYTHHMDDKGTRFANASEWMNDLLVEFAINDGKSARFEFGERV